MSRVFLSYAEEDRTIATELVSALIEAGHEVFNWQDASQRGKRFIDNLESQIYQADAFIVILSPYYLSSSWCRRERNLAIVRENALKDGHFIFVARTTSLDYPNTGLLAEYDFLDLAGSNRSTKINHLINCLPREKAMVTPPKQPRFMPPFRNRIKELEEVKRNLDNLAGSHMWQIVAASQMGKSWLLDRLAQELPEEDWTVVIVDLREERTDLRDNADSIIARFFGLSSIELERKGLLKAAARQVSASAHSWLYALDSAELLSTQAARQLRNNLSEVYEMVRGAGWGKQLAFIGASRRLIKEWQGVRPRPRFEELKLTPFTLNIFEEALQELAKNQSRRFSFDEISNKAKIIHFECEGLPYLLTAYLDWISQNGFIFDAHEIEKQLVGPYLSKDLLSTHSLLPHESNPECLEEKRRILEVVLTRLSVYRLITPSHVDSVLAQDPTLLEGLHRANWNKQQLWESLINSCLFEPSNEIWNSLYPSIRRLLCRYSHPSPDLRASAHRLAEDFTQEWLNDTLGIIERSVIFIECLWHRAVHVSLSSTSNSSQELKVFVNNLVHARLPSSSRLSPKDISQRIVRQLESDDELEELLSQIDENLSSEIRKLISSVGDESDSTAQDHR
jgi:hypothetical protein